MAFVGIDFGTTNSAVAIADDDGGVQLVPLAGAPHWRTVLYFEAGGALTAGAPAIARYLETEGDGRHRRVGRGVRRPGDRRGRCTGARARYALPRRDGRRGADPGVALRAPPALALPVVPQG